LRSPPRKGPSFFFFSKRFLSLPGQFVVFFFLMSVEACLRQYADSFPPPPVSSILQDRVLFPPFWTCWELPFLPSLPRPSSLDKQEASFSLLPTCRLKQILCPADQIFPLFFDDLHGLFSFFLFFSSAAPRPTPFLFG